MLKFFGLLASLFLVSCFQPDSICLDKSITSQAHSVQFQLEVACTDTEKSKGLMHRITLGKDDGMIFVYDKEDYYAFWMKNTSIPLSIAFLDSNKRIVDIRNMKPYDLTPVVTGHKAKYAIEMNIDWFKNNNIQIGDQIFIVN